MGAPDAAPLRRTTRSATHPGGPSFIVSDNRVDGIQQQLADLDTRVGALEATVGAPATSATLFVGDGSQEMDALSVTPATPVALADFTAPVFTQNWFPAPVRSL